MIKCSFSKSCRYKLFIVDNMHVYRLRFIRNSKHLSEDKTEWNFLCLIWL